MAQPCSASGLTNFTPTFKTQPIYRVSY